MRGINDGVLRNTHIKEGSWCQGTCYRVISHLLGICPLFPLRLYHLKIGGFSHFYKQRKIVPVSFLGLGINS